MSEPEPAAGPVSLSEGGQVRRAEIRAMLVARARRGGYRRAIRRSGLAIGVPVAAVLVWTFLPNPERQISVTSGVERMRIIPVSRATSSDVLRRSEASGSARLVLSARRQRPTAADDGELREMLRRARTTSGLAEGGLEELVGNGAGGAG